MLRKSRVVRALIISTRVPYFPATGASARDHYLVKHLVEEHQIKFVAPIYNQRQAEQACSLPDWIEFHPVEIPETSNPKSGECTSWMSKLLWHRIRRLFHIAFESPYEILTLGPTLAALEIALQRIDWDNIDIVQIEHSPIGRLRHAIPAQIPVLLDCHNVHSAIREREYRSVSRWRQRIAEWFEWQKTRAYERKTIREFDWLFACSDADRNKLRDLAGSINCSIFPNGVDTNYFHRHNRHDTLPETLLFVGTMSYEPNIEAVTFFCDRIFPIVLEDFPNAKVYIVGHEPTPLVRQLDERSSGSVVVTGSVEDVRPYMEKSAIGIVPLLNGGGTRLKILEMLAMEMPVVTTSVGCEGLEVIDGRHLCIADTPRQFAQSIGALFCDGQTRWKLGVKGRALVKEKYEWGEIVPTVSHIWRYLASS